MVLAVALSVCPDVGAQDAPKATHAADPYRCKLCAPALAKAYAYLQKNLNVDGGYPHVFAGFLYLADGQHPRELQRCVTTVTGGYWRTNGQNANWSMALSAIFLSEVYKRQPSDRIKTTLLDIMKLAESRIEPTGGFGHSKGYAASSGYTAKGGADDLGVLTCMMWGAMLNMRASGMEVNDRLFRRVQANLEKNADTRGVRYGTGNEVSDASMGRAAYAFLGLQASGFADTPFAKSIPEGLKERAAQTDQGHAFPPIHFAGAAMATHLLGPDAYAAFAGHWVDRLIALQNADGSIRLPHIENAEYQDDDRYVSSTAAFALVLVLQKSDRKAEPPAAEPPPAKPAPSTKPWLGVRLEPRNAVVRVVEVTPDSPAAKAGVREGDTITEFDGKEFEGVDGFRALVAATKPGTKVKVRVLREDGFATLEVVIGAEK
jgi:hypothetical protein